MEEKLKAEAKRRYPTTEETGKKHAVYNAEQLEKQKVFIAGASYHSEPLIKEIETLKDAGLQWMNDNERLQSEIEALKKENEELTEINNINCSKLNAAESELTAQAINNRMKSCDCGLTMNVLCDNTCKKAIDKIVFSPSELTDEQKTRMRELVSEMNSQPIQIVNTVNDEIERLRKECYVSSQALGNANKQLDFFQKENDELKFQIEQVKKFVNNTPNEVLEGLNAIIDRLQSELTALKSGNTSNKLPISEGKREVYNEVIEFLESGHHYDIASREEENSVKNEIIDLLHGCSKSQKEPLTESELRKYIREAINEHPTKVEAYKDGQMGLLGLFVGEAMKKSKGKADPKTLNALTKQMLDEPLMEGVKSADEIIDAHKQHSGIDYFYKSEIIPMMETYAAQFKYDFSKTCKCKYTTGETWCCNQCGLPTSKQSQEGKQVDAEVIKDKFYKAFGSGDLQNETDILDVDATWNFFAPFLQSGEGREIEFGGLQEKFLTWCHSENINPSKAQELFKKLKTEILCQYQNQGQKGS